MFFGYIKDHKTVYELVDVRTGKTFKRFNSVELLDDYRSRIGEKDLEGLEIRPLLVSWYNDNWELSKAVFPIVLVLFLVFWI